ncbi:hypothetical protein BDV95DRAFT_595365 [Massariosphaeria phaeospora]|uniref:Uncharacterized protein n=1 Tax=Massariosphaeria phaeospora TaxID=100035 RepID=A0A7C8I4H7_9PLEO|nr:hypothetical protein BDV95DRAFT_595365 [Massariosphaeria phaeospora]
MSLVVLICATAPVRAVPWAFLSSPLILQCLFYLLNEAFQLHINYGWRMLSSSLVDESDTARHELQSIILISCGPVSSLNSANRTITLALTVRQLWSAQPDRPLTISTRHTPLDPRGFLEDHFDVKINMQRRRKSMMMIRQCFKLPCEDDWRESMEFITIPSHESGECYTAARDLDITRLLDDEQSQLEAWDVVSLQMNSSFAFGRSPGVEWFNWSALNGSLKEKKLGYRCDPELNDKSRKEQAAKLPANLILSYDNWMDAEDDEGNEMIRLEMQFSENWVDVDIV